MHYLTVWRRRATVATCLVGGTAAGLLPVVVFVRAWTLR